MPLFRCCCFVAVVVAVLLLSLLRPWLLPLSSVAFLSLLMFPSFLVASIVIVHAYLRWGHGAVVLYRRHLMCPGHTYATPPLAAVSRSRGAPVLSMAGCGCAGG